MHIAAVRAIPVNIPFVAPYRFSYGSIASLTKTIVEVTTDDGLVGWGEAADGDRPSNHRATFELAKRKRGGLGTNCNPAEAKWLLDRLLEHENLSPGLRRDVEKILVKMKTEFL